MSLKNRRDANLISTKNLLHEEPFVISYGRGMYVYDTLGEKYLDMLGGFSVVSLGHSNENVINATKAQLDKMIHSTQVFLNEPIVTLAESLHALLDGSLNKSFFLNSGSEANEMAINLACKYTNKSDLLYLEHSLHGRTFKTLNVTNMKMWHPYQNMNDESLLVKTYYSKTDLAMQMEISLKDVETKLKANDNIAAMIIEPIQGNGGVLTPHKDYFKRLQSLLNSYGVLLILDEAQTCLGRLGTMFAHQYYDFIPDILMTSKSLGQGLPISAVTTTNAIAAKYTTPNASTTGGNMVSCACANAVINEIKNKNLVSHVNQVAPYFKEQLCAINHPLIGDIRGVGLMIGIEIHNDKAVELIQVLKTKNIIVGVSGVNRDILLIEPPLIIEPKHIDIFVTALSESLELV